MRATVAATALAGSVIAPRRGALHGQGQAPDPHSGSVRRQGARSAGSGADVGTLPASEPACPRSDDARRRDAAPIEAARRWA